MIEIGWGTRDPSSSDLSAGDLSSSVNDPITAFVDLGTSITIPRSTFVDLGQGARVSSTGIKILGSVSIDPCASAGTWARASVS